MKLGGWKVGLLINFNGEVLREGVHRMVLNLEEQKTSAPSAPLR
jgi:hypothetical protein